MVLVRETVLADRQALRDAPCAFSSTYEDQVKFGEADWRQPIARGGTFLAYLPEVGSPEASTFEPAGMADGYQAAPGQVELISM